MKVDDYLLINNINLLFDYPIIIYGAGKVGSRIADYLKKTEVVISCFCDKDCQKKECCGYEIIHIGCLKKFTDGTEYCFILASEIYYEEMLSQLELMNIGSKHIFTSWGVESGLAWNLNDQRILPEYREFQLKQIDKLLTYRSDAVAISNLKTALAKRPEILIYQMGKVGSSSVYKSLMNRNVNCMHVHVFHEFGDIEEGKILEGKYKDLIEKKGIKIITLLRDPIARYISEKLEGINFVCWSVEDGSKNLCARYIENLSKGNADLSGWFDQELEVMTGINVLNYPFNKDKGYAFIKERKIELLVLTMESMNRNRDIIGEFVGIENFQMMSDNIGTDKITQYVYKSIKEEIAIPDYVLDKYYKQDPFLQHFYEKDQIEHFRSRWSKNRS